MTLEAVGEAILDGAFVARPAVMDDLPAVFDMVQVSMMEAFGTSNRTLEEMRTDWEVPGFVVGDNNHVVCTPDGRLAGYAEVWDTREVPVRPWTWGYVLPEYRNQGIGTYLMGWLEARVRKVESRVPENARIVMMADCVYTDDATKRLLEAHGMTTERRSWHMLVEFDHEPEAPVWAEGITVTTLADYGDLLEVYRAVNDSFKDHRNYIDETEEIAFERFKHWVETDPNHDSTLWFLAMSGDKIAGISLCREHSWDDASAGFVNTLGVRREYRRRGIALALLQHSFCELWKRGQHKVSLGVDATSLTGATKLYEKAGMHVHYAFDIYEKELRPGVELSNQG